VSQRVGVVFVHGFLSSATTWSAFLDLLTDDDDLLTLSLHAFQYATPAVLLRPLRRIPNLNDIADSLDTYLTHDLAGQRRLALVGHSQGGLVIQRLLARMITDGRGRELARIRRIVLFTCPNTGSDLALSLRRRATFWRHPQERELRPLAENITDTHRTIINQVIHARAVSESSCPIRIIAYAGESDGVVTAASARSVFPEVGELPGDHFSIIRPDSRAHRSYVALKKHLQELSSDPEPPGSSPPAEPAKPEGPTRPGGADRGAIGGGRRGDVPAPRQPAGGGWQRELVEKLLAVPRMADPGFREQLYALLPPVIIHQVQRDSAARIELFALVRSFEHYRHLDPAGALAAALEALVPNHPAVAEVATVLAGADHPARPVDP
jgi:pimeloyl-ACP methyl ester carboxylesterase